MSDTPLHTRAHLAAHLDTGLSVWREDKSVPRCEVCTDRLGPRTLWSGPRRGLERIYMPKNSLAVPPWSWRPPRGLSPVSPGGGAREGLSDALEASRRESHSAPSPRSAPTSQACCLPAPAAASPTRVLWSQFHSRCDYNGKNREKGRPGAQGRVQNVGEPPLLSSVHLPTS